MNCDDYRDAIGADPSESFDGGAAHAASCDQCRGYRDEMRALDEKIARALAIDVPPLQMPDLAPVSPGARRSARPGATGRRRFRSPPLWAGLAASLALVAFLVVGLPEPEHSGHDLAAQIMSHMDHEEASRQVTSIPVADRTLSQVVEPRVAAMDRDVGLITYAMSCIINGRTAPHLVVQGRQGPVTLILMPDENIDAAIPLSGDNVHGVILPVGNGSIAVIGQREEQLDEVDNIGKRLASSVEWKI